MVWTATGSRSRISPNAMTLSIAAPGRDSVRRRWSRRADVVVCPLADGDIRFDVMVVAVGARPRPRPRQPGWLGLADLRRRDGRRQIRALADMRGRPWVTVVGGGATGLQYLFELNDALRRAGARCRLRLVDGGERLLPALPVDVP